MYLPSDANLSSHLVSRRVCEQIPRPLCPSSALMHSACFQSFYLRSSCSSQYPLHLKAIFSLLERHMMSRMQYCACITTRICNRAPRAYFPLKVTSFDSWSPAVPHLAPSVQSFAPLSWRPTFVDSFLELTHWNVLRSVACHPASSPQMKLIVSRIMLIMFVQWHARLAEIIPTPPLDSWPPNKSVSLKCAVHRLFPLFTTAEVEETWSTRYYSDIRSQISRFTFPGLDMPNLTLLPESDRKRFHNLRFLDPSSDLHSNSSWQCSIDPTFFRFLYPTVSIPSHQCEEKQ